MEDSLISSNMFQIKRDEGRIEKWVLRRAFDDEENPYLPKVITITNQNTSSLEVLVCLISHRLTSPV